MEIDLKRVKLDPKKELNQAKLEGVNELLVDFVIPALLEVSYGRTKRPIIAGGFPRDLHLGKDFDDIDIYLPWQFPFDRFKRILNRLCLEGEMTGSSKELVPQFELLTAKPIPRDLANKVLSFNEYQTDEYSVVNNHIKHVFLLTINKVKFNIMLTDIIPDEDFADTVVSSFGICISKVWMDLDGVIHTTEDFLNAIKTKTIKVDPRHMGKKYIYKVIKYFPEYNFNLVTPLWDQTTRGLHSGELESEKREATPKEGFL